jgi:hypothetical protein
LAAMPARMLGVAEEGGMMRWASGAIDGAFSPGKGSGEGGACGGKGLWIHHRTEGNGRPLAHRTPPAKGAELAQVVPLLETVKIHPGKRGRPHQRLKVIAQRKAMTAQALCQPLRQRGLRGQLPKRVWQTKGRSPLKDTLLKIVVSAGQGPRL